MTPGQNMDPFGEELPIPQKQNIEVPEVLEESAPVEPIKRPSRSIPAKNPFNSDSKPKKEWKSAIASVFERFSSRGLADKPSSKVRSEATNPLAEFSVGHGSKFDPSQKIRGLKLNLSGAHLLVSVLWIALFLLMVYGYQSGTYTTIENIPTQKKNVEISKANLVKQKAEADYLEKLALDPSDLEKKEKIVSDRFPVENPKLALQTTQMLNKIATDSNVTIASFQKIETPKTKDLQSAFWKSLAVFEIDDFFEHAWFIDYQIALNWQESDVLKFIAAVEKTPFFRTESFWINRNPTDIGYSVLVRAYYITQQ